MTFRWQERPRERFRAWTSGTAPFAETVGKRFAVRGSRACVKCRSGAGAVPTNPFQRATPAGHPQRFSPQRIPQPARDQQNKAQGHIPVVARIGPGSAEVLAQTPGSLARRQSPRQASLAPFHRDSTSSPSALRLIIAATATINPQMPQRRLSTIAESRAYFTSPWASA